MSTQEKVQGLGLSVPDRAAYGDGSCIPGEGVGAPAAAKELGVAVDWPSDWLSHRPQIFLQLALQNGLSHGKFWR